MFCQLFFVLFSVSGFVGFFFRFPFVLFLIEGEEKQNFSVGRNCYISKQKNAVFVFFFTANQSLKKNGTVTELILVLCYIAQQLQTGLC